MSRLLIQNPLLTTTMNDGQDEFEGGHILIDGSVINSIGPEPFSGNADIIIDAKNMVVIPGFVNTHHHFYQTLTRNIPRMQDDSLFAWLTDHYELWRELTEQGANISAQTAILELMKSGVSTSSDHLYLFPRKAGPRLIDAEISAAKSLGFRFQPTRGSMSLGILKGGLPPDDMIQTEAEIQKDTERLVKQYHDDSSGSMIRISLAPCSPFSVTEKLLRQTADFANENQLHLHTHLAETIEEESFCLETFGKRPVDYLEDLGWMTERSWFAHAIHINTEEINRLGSVAVGVAHCPSSNMRLGSGTAKISEMLKAGINVGLGVDGSASNDSSNMLAEIRQALLISRMRSKEYWLNARDVFWMATRGGAHVLGRNDIGQLKPGLQADIALFAVDGIEYAGSLSDPLAALVFTHRLSPVDYLIINGEIQIERGKLKIDEQKLIDQHNRLSNKMLQKAYLRTGISFEERRPK
ncbi:MAG: 8-oxoguanine deaminase [Candidatus Neomarinimicrobiota bacterium]